MHNSAVRKDASKYTMNMQSPTMGLYIKGTCTLLRYLTTIFANVTCPWARQTQRQIAHCLSSVQPCLTGYPQVLIKQRAEQSDYIRVPWIMWLPVRGHHFQRVNVLLLAEIKYSIYAPPPKNKVLTANPIYVKFPCFSLPYTFLASKWKYLAQVGNESFLSILDPGITNIMHMNCHQTT